MICLNWQREIEDDHRDKDNYRRSNELVLVKVVRRTEVGKGIRDKINHETGVSKKKVSKRIQSRVERMSVRWGNYSKAQWKKTWQLYRRITKEESE